MIVQLFTIALALIGIIVLSGLFLFPIIELLANMIILYFLFLRINTEITKYKRGEIYLFAFPASCLILIITGNFTPLWWITTASMLTFVLVQIYHIIKHYRK